MDVTDVVRSEDGYEVFSDGRVFTYSRSQGPKRGNAHRVYWDRPGRPVKASSRQDGYVKISLRGKKEYLHRVVWEFFNGPIPTGLQIRHRNGDKSDNRLANLALGTQSENELDKWDYGVMPHGNTHFNARLTAEIVKTARVLYSSGWMYRCIQDELSADCSISALQEAVLGRTWKHLSGETPDPRTVRGKISACPCPRHQRKELP